jgi:hypothetical protein
MSINIFKGKYLVPPKCGSRFFNQHWGNRKGLKPNSTLGSSDWIDIINRESIPLFELKDSKFVNEIEWMVLREPFEFMKSAIHTEFINFWNDNKKNGIVTEMDVLDWISKWDSHSHWHPNIFRELYLFTLKFKKPPTIIMLSDLNHFVENVLNETYSSGFSKSEYDFSQYPIWVSKDDLWNNYLKSNYPNECEGLSNLLIADTFFWDKLIKLCPNYVPIPNGETEKFKIEHIEIPKGFI